MQILVTINPMNDKWCGTKCPQELAGRCGTRVYCRLFSESFGGDGDLEYDENLCLMRHPKCIEAEKNGGGA